MGKTLPQIRPGHPSDSPNIDYQTRTYARPEDHSENPPQGSVNPSPWPTPGRGTAPTGWDDDAAIREVSR